MMGFITEVVRQQRQDHVREVADQATREKAEAEGLAAQEALLREAEYRQAVEQFCSVGSLQLIAAAVADAVVREFVSSGYVGCVKVLWDMPESLFQDPECTRSLLAHLQQVEPMTKRVELTRTAYHKYKRGIGAIYVEFENGLRPS